MLVISPGLSSLKVPHQPRPSPTLKATSTWLSKVAIVAPGARVTTLARSLIWSRCRRNREIIREEPHRLSVYRAPSQESRTSTSRPPTRASSMTSTRRSSVTLERMSSVSYVTSLKLQILTPLSKTEDGVPSWTLYPVSRISLHRTLFRWGIDSNERLVALNQLPCMTTKVSTYWSLQIETENNVA